LNQHADDIKSYINALGAKARMASRGLSLASTDAKNNALFAVAKALRNNMALILDANKKDVAFATEKGRSASFIDRLILDTGRIEAIAKAVESIAALPDPVGRQLAEFDRPNGLKIERVAVPIGVIGMVFESRPNVGADAGALCLKSGNAVILRGGSESRHSTQVIVDCMRSGLSTENLPEDAIQAVETADRSAVKHLLHCTDYIDLVIPRGGRSLVELVRDEARVPTLLHLDGNCHTYVHSNADLEKALAVIMNAKLRRTGVCGATESLVVDRSIASTFVPALAATLTNCEIRGDHEACALSDAILPANDADWGTEYLDAIVSLKVVADLDEALKFVSHHSSGHTDAIITEDEAAAQRFFSAIDSAVVMHNASTQFSDGGEFGMGAEIGIATGKMHARGPVGLEQLTSFKYLVHGTGQTRPS
jgi:glutamate-5-semialdehyde dehydrogenase